MPLQAMSPTSQNRSPRTWRQLLAHNFAVTATIKISVFGDPQRMARSAVAMASSRNAACVARPQSPHIETHFTASETVRDIVIGMSDGLTVPFALAAGLSGAVDSSGIIVTAGLAEVAAGAIAMGLG